MTIVIGVTDTPTFTNYSGLQEAIIDFLDARGQDRVAEFIGFAEDYLRIALDTVDREASVTGTASPFPVPNAKRILAVAADGCAPLRQITLDDALTNFNYTGTPTRFTYFAGNVSVYPTPGEPRTFRAYYIEQLPRLSDASQTNWLIDRCPSLYLYAALVHAEGYLRDPSWIDRFWAYVTALVDGLNDEAQKKRWTGALMPELGSVP